MSELAMLDDPETIDLIDRAHRIIAEWDEGYEGESPMTVAAFQEVLRHLLAEARAFHEQRAKDE